MIGRHCADPPDMLDSACPAGQENVDVPPELPPHVRMKLICQVVILHEAIWRPVMVLGAISLPLIRPLNTNPPGVTLSTQFAGPPRSQVFTHIPEVVRATLLVPCGEPSLVIRSSWNVEITLLIVLCICRSA